LKRAICEGKGKGKGKGEGKGKGKAVPLQAWSGPEGSRPCTCASDFICTHCRQSVPKRLATFH